MNLFEEISKYRNTKYLKDLVWILLSPSPIKKETLVPLVEDGLKEQWYIENKAMFEELLSDEKKLILFVQTHLKNSRLGYYFECLLHAFFYLSDEFDIFFCNHQIIKNGVTHGEIDFVIQYKDEIYHIEAAVKFYLKSEKNANVDKWLGPNAKDSLGKKLDKLRSHQLKLCKELEVNLSILQSKALICGQFYQNNAKNVWQSEASPKSSYYHFNDFIQTFQSDENTQFFFLEKQDWLANAVLPNDALRVEGFELLCEKISLALENKKAVRLGLLDNSSYRTIFVVFNSWPKLP